MESADIVQFAETRLEPIRNKVYGDTYRCAAWLHDGVYLPCVLLGARERRSDFAVRNILERIEDSKKPPETRRFGNGMGVPNLIDLYAARGNRVDAHYLARIEPSPHAISWQHLGRFTRETSMSWTQFVAEMRDGKELAFGSPGDLLFFEMPDGYTGKDVVAVRPHETLPGKVWPGKPFFDCYVDGL